MRTFCTLAFVAVITVTLLGKQQSAPALATQHTGQITGTVVDARTQPVRSAIVRLTGANLGHGRGAITDDKGRFSLDGLPPGRFTLTSSKPSYLPSAYGATRPGGPGTPIALAAGEQVDLTISMPRGSAITGVVRDSHGAPMTAVLVAVARTNAPASTTGARPETVSTDDRGVYRIYGLPPGKYLVYADRGLSGGIGGIGMMSAADVDAAFARLKQRLSGAPSPPSEPAPSSVVRPTSTFTPAPVFHPGVTSPAAAMPVEVALEQVREGIDIVYQLAPTLIVTGNISGAGTQNVQIGLIPGASNVPSGLAFGSGPMLERRAGTGDGPFTFTNVLPGRYTLTARTSPAAGRAGAPAPPAGPLLSASTIVEVTSDITGLALALQRMPGVAGRVVFEGTSQPPAETLAAMTIRINPVGATTTPGGGVIGASIAAVQPDGTFHMPAVQPGAYRLSDPRGPAGWTVRSAQLAGRDVLDLPLEVTNDVSGLEIRFSDRQTRLTGRLLQTDGTPAPGYFIVAFAADRAAWFPDSRRLLSVRPGTDGGFRFENLPPGQYYLAALIDADSAEWQSPDFLEQVVASAVKFAIGDGEQKIQDLRIRRPGR